MHEREEWNEVELLGVCLKDMKTSGVCMVHSIKNRFFFLKHEVPGESFLFCLLSTHTIGFRRAKRYQLIVPIHT